MSYMSGLPASPTESLYSLVYPLSAAYVNKTNLKLFSGWGGIFSGSRSLVLFHIAPLSRRLAPTRRARVIAMLGGRLALMALLVPAVRAWWNSILTVRLPLVALTMYSRCSAELQFAGEHRFDVRPSARSKGERHRLRGCSGRYAPSLNALMTSFDGFKYPKSPAISRGDCSRWASEHPRVSLRDWVQHAIRGCEWYKAA
jgi:hypothetical protein